MVTDDGGASGVHSPGRPDQARGWGVPVPGRRSPRSGTSPSASTGSDRRADGGLRLGQEHAPGGLAGILPAGSRGRLTVEAPAVRPAPAGAGRAGPRVEHRDGAVGDDLAFPLENLAVTPSDLAAGGAARRRSGSKPASLGTRRSSAAASSSSWRSPRPAGDPALLLLDEPTANLDEGAVAAVVRAVLAERERTGCTVVVIEHRVRPGSPAPTWCWSPTRERHSVGVDRCAATSLPIPGWPARVWTHPVPRRPAGAGAGGGRAGGRGTTPPRPAGADRSHESGRARSWR